MAIIMKANFSKAVPIEPAGTPNWSSTFRLLWIVIIKVHVFNWAFNKSIYPALRFEFKSFVDGEVYPVKIKFLGKDNIKIRNGKFACLKFCPVIQTGRIFKNEEDLTVWISDDENKIPLLAKANIMVGSIKMEVTEYEGLKNKVARL